MKIVYLCSQISMNFISLIINLNYNMYMKKHFLKHLLMMLLLPCASAFAAEGDTIVVLEQNFDAFTEGTESTPATTDISSYSSNKLRNTLANWSGSRVYEAGGSLKIGDNGYLQTANTDMSGNGGNLRITFRAKALDATGGGIQILLNSSYTATATIYLDNGDWTTIEVMCGGGKASGYLRIKPYLIASGMLIDDLKIEASQAFIGAPEATQPTTASDNSFTATWKVVAGATSYLLDVYSKNGEEKEYLLKDEAVDKPSSSYATTHSKQVTGLTAGKKYYFTVRAKRDEYVSAYSNEIRVVKPISSVSAPEATEATDVTATGFTANWNAVEGAEGYEVSLYKHEILANDSTVNILHDDFSGFTEGTLSSPSYPSTYALDTYTADPGWTASNICAANGYFGIGPFGGTGYICTPAIDLSKNSGKFKLTIKVASNSYGTYKEDSVKVYIYNGGDDAVDSATVKVSGGFANYTVESEKGNAGTYIYIEYSGSNKFFFDEIAVTQDLTVGDKVTSLVETKDVGDVTSCLFDVAFTDNISYSYKVAAYAPTVKGSSYTGYYVDNIYSGKSNEIEVSYSDPTAINDIDREQETVKDGKWYTLQGVLLNGKPTTKGIYIVNGKKVLVK